MKKAKWIHVTVVSILAILLFVFSSLVLAYTQNTINHTSYKDGSTEQAFGWVVLEEWHSAPNPDRICVGTGSVQFGYPYMYFDKSFGGCGHSYSAINPVYILIDFVLALAVALGMVKLVQYMWRKRKHAV